MKLSTALAALNTGAWSGATAYIGGQIVTSAGSSYICILAHTNHTPPNATYWALLADKGAAGSNGSNGSNGTNGADGIFGGAVAIPYVFSTTTTDADPGSGKLRLSNATQNAATVIRADLNNADAVDVTAILDSFNDSTHSPSGYIRLVKKTDNTKWLVYSVTSVASPSGYRNITVVPVASSASSPFADLDDIILFFDMSGDNGVGVPAGGSTGQVLSKINGTDYNTEWTTPGGGGSATFSGVSCTEAYSQNSGHEIVSFNSENFDVGGYHSTSSNQYQLVAPVTGYYYVHAIYQINDLNATGVRKLRLEKNAGAWLSSDEIPGRSSGSSAQVLELSGVVQRNAGQYIDVDVTQTSGSTLSVTVTVEMILLGV